MTQQVEIEFKNSLIKSEYNQLLSSLNLSEKDFHLQENYYYDTKDWKLKNLYSALRIRLFSDSAELTLKTPLGKNHLETTDDLSLKQGKLLLDSHTIKSDGYVAAQLKNLNVDLKELFLFGSLVTKRYEQKIEQGMIVLDKSSYGSKTDYELEFETPSREVGEIYFEQFLRLHSIKKRPTKNKIRRMMESI